MVSVIVVSPADLTFFPKIDKPKIKSKFIVSSQIYVQLKIPHKKINRFQVVWRTIEDFCKNSGIDGLKYAADRNRRWLER